MSKQIQVDVTLELEDHVRVGYRLFFSRMWWAVALFALGTGAAVRYASSQDQAGLQATLYPSIIAVLVSGVLLWLLATPYMQARRSMRVPGADTRTSSYTVGRSGFTVSTGGSRATVAWDDVLKAEESSSDFFIFANANVAHVIPKRCLADADEVAALRSSLSEALGGRARVSG